MWKIRQTERVAENCQQCGSRHSGEAGQRGEAEQRRSSVTRRSRERKRGCGAAELVSSMEQKACAAQWQPDGGVSCIGAHSGTTEQRTRTKSKTTLKTGKHSGTRVLEDWNALIRCPHRILAEQSHVSQQFCFYL